MGRSEPVSDDRIARVRELLLTRIARYGYTMTQVIGVGGSRRATYTYTLGLPHHMGHPELAVCGIGPEKAIDVITSVVELLQETPALEGRVVGALERDMPLWIAPLPDDAVAAHLGAAGWWRREHHDGEPATAKQVVICDPAGRFPWEPGCEAGYGRMQSLLLPEIAVREPRAAATESNQQGGADASD
jgi:hypothetical protein